MTDTYQGRTAEEWATAYTELHASTQDDFNNIYEKQLRDNAERQTMFAVADEEGRTGTPTSDYEVAVMVAEATGGHVVTRPEYPWKRINTTTETNEGN